MHSAGGLVSPQTARPFRSVCSSRARPAVASQPHSSAKLAGKPDVISFDMGGTTAKACLVEDGRTEIAPMMEAARVHRFTRGSGLPIKAPVIDMIEIGAGGGSIARIDEVGLLARRSRIPPALRRVPHATATAAPSRRSPMPISCSASTIRASSSAGACRSTLPRRARALEKVAVPLGLGIEAAAQGIHAVVTESMAAAVRVHLVEKGKDPRAYAMVGFGGAGPAHAAGVARALGVREVIVPPASGAASAFGFLTAPLSFETARSRIVEFKAGFDALALNAMLAELEADGRARLLAAGIADADVRVERFADMRLVGQMHDISVPLPAAALSEASLVTLRKSFHAVYAERYAEIPEDSTLRGVEFPCTRQCARFRSAHRRCGRRYRPGVEAQGPPPRLVRWSPSTMSASGTAMRLFPAIASKGPRSSRSAKRRRSSAPGDVIEIDASLNLRIAVFVREAPAARITAATPLAEAVHLIESDPVSLEIMWSRLVNVTEEMWLTVCRTAFSLVISEAQDFACELLDPTGETLAHSPRAMPVFNLTLPRAVKALLEAYPPETLTARRRPRHQRSLAVRRASVRHRRGDARVPRWRPRRIDRYCRPCLRHRRHQGFAARARDL